MRKKYIQLPKGYLSQSQIVLWQRDKERYTKIYMDGRDEYRVSNSEMEYGKTVATALEEEKDTEDLLTDTAISLLTKYDVRDQEIRAEIKTKYGAIPVLGKPDTFNSKTHEFREYKTGKVAWTQSKADKHFQLKFYAMLIYLKYGTVTKETWLDWIETEEVEGEIRPTGRVIPFKVQLGLEDIIKTMALTQKIAKEIEIVWVTHVAKPQLTW